MDGVERTIGCAGSETRRQQHNRRGTAIAGLGGVPDLPRMALMRALRSRLAARKTPDSASSSMFPPSPKPPAAALMAGLITSVAASTKPIQGADIHPRGVRIAMHCRQTAPCIHLGHEFAAFLGEADQRGRK
jgi:hypothetical protein